MDILHRLKEQRSFVFERDGKGIDSPQRDDPVSMDRFIGEFHLFTREGRGAFGDLDRQLSHTRDFFQ